MQLSQKEKIIDKRVDNPEDTERHAVVGPQSASRRCATRTASRHVLRRLRADAEGDLQRARVGQALDLNMATLEFLRENCRSPRRCVLSSTLAADGQRPGSCSTSARRSAPTAFLAAWVDSRDYLNQAAFDEAGMGVVWQQLDASGISRNAELRPSSRACPRSTPSSTAGRARAEILRECAPR